MTPTSPAAAASVAARSGGTGRGGCGRSVGKERGPGDGADDAVHFQRRPVRIGKAGLKSLTGGRRPGLEGAAHGDRPAAGLVQPPLDLADEVAFFSPLLTAWPGKERSS